MRVPSEWTPVLERLSRETEAAFRQDRAELVHGHVPPPRGDVLTFLGTGGNPTNLVRQIRATAGFHVALGGVSLYVDPGPGALWHARRAGLDLRGLDAVFVSHAHTDHSQCTGAVVEAMCRGMTQRRGLLMGPDEALARVSDYHQGKAGSAWYPGGPEAVVRLAAGVPVAIRPGVTLTPVPAFHGGENFGFRLEAPGLALGYTSDTRYLLSYETADGRVASVRPGEPLAGFVAAHAVEERLVDAFRGVDVLVANVSFLDLHAHRHLTVLGAADLFARAGVRLGVLTHFDPSLGRPEIVGEVAALVGRLLGIPVVAAHDGLVLDLAPWRGDGGAPAGAGLPS
jgi:hypothetical protein